MKGAQLTDSVILLSTEEHESINPKDFPPQSYSIVIQMGVNYDIFSIKNSIACNDTLHFQQRVQDITYGAWFFWTST